MNEPASITASAASIAPPHVSVAMACFNAAPYLREAIDSILNQTFRDFEFLIINDGSTDDSHDVIASYRDARIRLIENSGNQGLIYSLNRALHEARADWIARMDADDVSDPERLAAQWAFAHERNLDICYCDWKESNFDGGLETVHRDSAVPPVVRRWRVLFENLYGAHAVALFRRQAIIDVGGYDPAYRHSEDYDLWFRCARAGLNAGHLPRVLYHRRLLETSVTGSMDYRTHAPAIALIRRSTSVAAMSTLAASVKVIVTSDRPSAEEEVITSILAIPATASSMGRVMSRSTSSGAAPG